MKRRDHAESDSIDVLSGMHAGTRAGRSHFHDSKATIEGLYSTNKGTRTRRRASYPSKDFVMREQMKTPTHETIRFGDLVVTAYDEAAFYSSDPKEVSRLAIQALTHMLRSTRRILAAPPLPIVAK